MSSNGYGFISKMGQTITKKYICISFIKWRKLQWKINKYNKGEVEMSNFFEGYDLPNRIISITLDNVEYILMEDGKYHFLNEKGEWEILKDINSIERLNLFTN